MFSKNNNNMRSLNKTWRIQANAKVKQPLTILTPRNK